MSAREPPPCPAFHTRGQFGKITDETGAAVKGATVDVLDDESRQRLARAASDETGRFLLPQRPHERRLRVTFSAEGFLDGSEVIQIVRWPGDGWFRI